MLKRICQDASLLACCLGLAGLPLPVGGPCNAQAHGGGQGDARAKGKHCRAAGKENLCHPKGTTGARLCLWLCGPGIPSPTPLGAMRTATGGSLWSWRPGWSLCQRRAGTTKAQLAAGGRESLHLQHNFHPNKRSSGHFQSPTAL